MIRDLGGRERGSGSTDIGYRALRTREEVAGLVAQHAVSEIGEEGLELVGEEVEQARRSGAHRQNHQAHAACQVRHKETLQQDA